MSWLSFNVEKIAYWIQINSEKVPITNTRSILNIQIHLPSNVRHVKLAPLPSNHFYPFDANFPEFVA